MLVTVPMGPSPVTSVLAGTLVGGVPLHRNALALDAGPVDVRDEPTIRPY
jgi:hypothetical protein